jgi:hypothetical protein
VTCIYASPDKNIDRELGSEIVCANKCLYSGQRK